MDSCVLLFMERQPSVGQGLLSHYVPRSHTQTHQTRQDSSGRVISSSQKPIPDKTHNRQTSVPTGGIRTHNLSRRAAADPRLRLRGPWDRYVLLVVETWNVVSCVEQCKGTFTTSLQLFMLSSIWLSFSIHTTPLRSHKPFHLHSES